MATTITYTQEERDTLFDASWKGSGRGMGTVRALKMVRPECNICQVNDEQFLGWWKECVAEGHDPYFTLQPKVVRVPKYVLDEDGDFVLDEEETKKASRTKFIRMANVVEVMATIASNSGIGPEKKQKRYGFMLPRDVDVAPMCEASGCGKAWPTVRTEYGDYCSVRHAKMCIADAEGTFFTVYVDPETGEKGRQLQRKEFQDVII